MAPSYNVCVFVIVCLSYLVVAEESKPHHVIAGCSKNYNVEPEQIKDLIKNFKNKSITEKEFEDSVLVHNEMKCFLRCVMNERFNTREDVDNNFPDLEEKSKEQIKNCIREPRENEDHCDRTFEMIKCWRREPQLRDSMMEYMRNRHHHHESHE